MSLAGLGAEAVDLLRKLPDFDADRYAGVKGQLKTGLVDPGGDLIEDLAG